ncbi:NmrA-like family protein [Rhexocercosporidium sp. MPI-PUGE-AT-0058]|nr:NmrA-like family protein [Rhexocercosporidium sp. MPI-PUGE-AT-0058]
MVKIAIAGGSGQIASEIIDVLISKGIHDILILSRKAHASDTRPGVTCAQTDYTSVTELTTLFQGIDVVLSFGAAHEDVGSVMQKALIEACIAAGVKRFAPNEWSTSNFEEIPWYAEKGNTRAYLAEINKDKKVLEYTLFQPGFIVDYIAPPNTSSKHITPLEIALDLSHRRAIVLEGVDPRITLTSVRDVAEVVARAVEWEGEWPVVGGMVGTTLKTSEFIEIGGRIRGGKPWPITTLKEADVRAGDIKSSWIPTMRANGLKEEQIEYFSKMVLTGFLLCGKHESWMVSDEWNRLLSDYEFEGLEGFLERTWAGRP